MSTKAVYTFLIFGVVLFAVSYFLPAVAGRNSDTDSMMRGYVCAGETLYILWENVKALGQFPEDGSWWPVWVVGLSGMNNLLVPIYLLARNGWKRGLGVAILLCGGVAVPVSLLSLEMHALRGCYLWLAGTLLILVPEFLKTFVWKADAVQVYPVAQDLHKEG
jgi:hypothetical protein